MDTVPARTTHRVPRSSPAAPPRLPHVVVLYVPRLMLTSGAPGNRSSGLALSGSGSRQRGSVAWHPNAQASAVCHIPLRHSCAVLLMQRVPPEQSSGMELEGGPSEEAGAEDVLPAREVEDAPPLDVPVKDTAVLEPLALVLLDPGVLVPAEEVLVPNGPLDGSMALDVLLPELAITIPPLDEVPVCRAPLTHSPVSQRSEPRQSKSVLHSVMQRPSRRMVPSSHGVQPQVPPSPSNVKNTHVCRRDTWPPPGVPSPPSTVGPM